MQEIDEFDEEISVLPNGLKKYMAFIINKNLVSIDNMQFISSSLDGLIKNLTDNDFKYLSQGFIGDLLKLVKQKGVYSCEYMGSCKKFSEDKLPDKSKFFNSLKDECINKKRFPKAFSNGE